MLQSGAGYAAGNEQPERLQSPWYKKVTLLFNPGAIEVEHYRIARLVRIGNVRHKFRIDRIASVRPARIVEIYVLEKSRCV